MKWISLLFVMVTTIIHAAPIARLTMRFDQPQYLITPVCEAGQKYYLKVSGTYRIIDQDRDASYVFNIYGGPRSRLVSTGWPNFTWFWNGVSTNVPYADSFQENHTYYFYFVGRGVPEHLSHANPHPDSSSGALTFELYKASSIGDESLSITKTNLVLSTLIIGATYDVEWTSRVEGGWQKLFSIVPWSHTVKMNLGTDYGTGFYRLKRDVQ